MTNWTRYQSLYRAMVITICCCFPRSFYLTNSPTYNTEIKLYNTHARPSFSLSVPLSNANSLSCCLLRSFCPSGTSTPSLIIVLIYKSEMSLSIRKPRIWVSDPNLLVQSRKQAISLKFWMQVKKEFYYPYRENKGADQLCSSVTAQLIYTLVLAYADCWFSDVLALLAC